jgi:preprotein translocase subunit SecA
VAEEHEEVVEAGGLYVLGTERHESRRIDNQLRGRSGRQGDPGESRFYLSLEDDLMRLFNSERVGAIMERLNIPADTPVESKVVTRAIRSAQTQVEQQNFEIRKDVLKYDDVMNRQRQVIYGERRKVLEGADLHEQIGEMVDEVIAGYVAGATADGYPEEWDLDKLWRAFRQLFPIGISVDDVVEDVGGERAGLSGEFITEAAIADAQAAYERREEELSPELMREFERRVVLSVLDRKWREHLYEMDYLREGIGLRGYGQRDPLVEYQREGYDMFGAMMDGIKEESVGNLFNLQVQVQENPIVEEAAPDDGTDPGAPGASAPDGAGPGAPGTTAAPGRPEAAAAGPVTSPGTPAAPAAGVPGPRPAGAPARGSAPAGGQRAQRGPRTQGGATADGTPNAPARTGGAHARPAAGQRASQPAAGQRAAGQRATGQSAAGQSAAGQSAAGQSAAGQRAGQPAAGQRTGQPAAGQQATGQSAAGQPAAGQPAAVPAGFAPRRAQQLQYSAPSVDGGAHVETSRGPAAGDEYARVGRNDPCPCGSGRKFKRCHGDPRMRPDG